MKSGAVVTSLPFRTSIMFGIRRLPTCFLTGVALVFTLAISQHARAVTEKDAQPSAIQVSDVQTAGVAADTASLKWKTNTAVESRATYGTTSGYELTALAPVGTPKTTDHALVLRGLAPDTVYHFRIEAAKTTAMDVDRVFSTLSRSTWYGTMAPFYLVALILFASVPIIIDIRKTYSAQKDVIARVVTGPGLTVDQVTALLQASSGIPGLGRYTIAITVVMVIGLGLFQLLVMPVEYSAGHMQLVTSVLSLLGGTLATITGFYFGGKTAEAIQKNAQQAAASPRIAGGAQISNVTATPIPGTGDVTITWITSVPGDTQVAYGPTTAYGTLAPVTPADQANPVTNHTVVLHGLTPQIYHYQVLSEIAGVALKSPDQTFTVGPQISNVTATRDPATGDVTITWTTSAPGDTEVAYGTTTAYGTVVPSVPADQANPVTNHTVVLHGLATGSYHYQVLSKVGESLLKSSDRVFTV